MANSILDVKDLLNEYSLDIQEGIDKEAQEIAKQAVIELKATSPKRPKSGKYARGWRVNTKKGRGFINCTVHNATNWQLTHLLENGHRIMRNGEKVGVADAKVHIRPVEQKVINQYQQDVEKLIKNGG